MDLHIKDVLKQYIQKEQRFGDAFYGQKIEAYWNEALPESITSRTSALNFKNGVLKIYVTSAPLRQQLHMGRQKLIDKINEHLELDLVRSIELG